MINEEVVNDMRELHKRARRDMDALNNEVDDVRARQIDVSNMLYDLKNHFFTLQATYVKLIVHNKKFKKAKCVLGFVVVVVVGVLTYKFFYQVLLPSEEL